MKTAGRETQTRYTTVSNVPSSWSGRQEHILLNDRGWKTRKNPVAGEVFFLTFPFIELIRHYCDFQGAMSKSKRTSVKKCGTPRLL